MSVRTRVEDVKVLYVAKRLEGCLLMLLIAVAATSRKRYPKGTMSDGEAFKKFLHDEMKTVTGHALNFNLQFRGKMKPLEDVLYHFVRCELTHEGTLPKDFILDDRTNFRVEVTETAVIFSEGLLQGLFRAVIQAHKNKDEFTDLLKSFPPIDRSEENTEPCQ